MDNRQNIMAMMGLGAAIVALGGSIVFGDIFKPEHPKKEGFAIEAVEEAGGGDAAKADPPIAMMMAGADVTAGGEVFKKCASCHTVNQGGANGIGPNLYGTLGEEVGKGKGGFAFSDALSGKGGKWDFDAMNAWLKSPKAFAPGTKMSFAGLSKAEDRANLIAYLNAQGSNLPLPAAPVQAAADGNSAAPADNAAAPTANATEPAKK